MSAACKEGRERGAGDGEREGVGGDGERGGKVGVDGVRN